MVLLDTPFHFFDCEFGFCMDFEFDIALLNGRGEERKAELPFLNKRINT